MKKVIMFVSLIVITGVIVTAVFIKNQSKLEISKEEKIEVKQQEIAEEKVVEENSTNEIIEDKPKEEITNVTEDIPKTESKVEQKVEENKPKQEVVEETTIPVVEEIPKQQTAWDELGITEYDYYNKPMWSWARIDFKVSDYASEEETINACRSYGHKLMEEQGLGFSCSSINSYSGNYLGEMLKTF